MIKTNKKEYSILLVMIGMTLISKFLGLYRDILIASNYGVTTKTDAFFVASRVPTYFFDLALSAAVVSTFIPTFNQVMKKEGRHKAFEYANQFISLGTIVSVAVMSFLIVFPKLVVKIVGPGLNAETLEFAEMLTRIMSPVVVFAFITYTFVGLLQSFEHFNIAALISVFSNLVVILYMIFFSTTYGFKGLAVAVIIGWLLQALVQIPVMKKEKYHFKVNFNWRSAAMMKTLKMSLPTLLITWGQPLSTLISTALASFFMGGVSRMEYAMRVFIIVTGVVVYSITNYIFPKLSSLYDPHDTEPFKLMVERTLLFFLYFALPITMLLSYFSNEVIVILFQRGSFGPEDGRVTGLLLRGLSFGLLGMGIREILNRVYFSIGHTKTPLRITMIGLLLNVILGLSMSKVWGLEGLAYAVSLTMIITSIYQLVNGLMKNDFSLSKPVILSMVKLGCVDGLLIMVVLILKIQVKGSFILQLTQLIGWGIVFLGLHIVVLKLLKVSVPHIQGKELEDEIHNSK